MPVTIDTGPAEGLPEFLLVLLRGLLLHALLLLALGPQHMREAALCLEGLTIAATS